jgi:CRP-like cAMP-binding protein
VYKLLTTGQANEYKDGKLIGTLGKGRTIGSQAITFGEYMRETTVKALTPVEVSNVDIRTKRERRTHTHRSYIYIYYVNKFIYTHSVRL